MASGVSESRLDAARRLVEAARDLGAQAGTGEEDWLAATLASFEQLKASLARVDDEAIERTLEEIARSVEYLMAFQSRLRRLRTWKRALG